jgi:hypothetical protein
VATSAGLMLRVSVAVVAAQVQLPTSEVSVMVTGQRLRSAAGACEFSVVALGANDCRCRWSISCLVQRAGDRAVSW